MAIAHISIKVSVRLNIRQVLFNNGKQIILYMQTSIYSNGIGAVGVFFSVWLHNNVFIERDNETMNVDVQGIQ